MTENRDILLRTITWSVSALFVGLGLWLMIQPQSIENLYPISLNGPMAFSEIRAIFGGMMAGIGGAVLSLDLIYKRQQEAAMVLATVIGGFVLARLVGLGIEGFPSGAVLTETIFEIVAFTLLVGLGAYRPSE